MPYVFRKSRYCQSPKPGFFSANATEMRYCLLSLQYIAEGNMLTYVYRA